MFKLVLEKTEETEIKLPASVGSVGEGNGNLVQYPCLENPRDGGAWWAAVYGVVQSWTWLKWLSSSSSWIIEKAREFQKTIYFWFSDYTKAFVCVDHNKLWKILQEMGIPDHFTHLLWVIMQVKMKHLNWTWKIDWFKIGKGVCQGCILSPCLFKLYANASWEIPG